MREVISDILIITRLPAANAAAAGSTTNCRGKFHGPMIPTTPSGLGCTSACSPTSRAARISLPARIHCLMCDRVCSITGTMPTNSVASDADRDRVPKSAAIASTKASVLSSTIAINRSMR